MYAQRTIPALLDICRDIREVAKPDALFLNYSNPMAMNTWACNKYGGVKTIGLCHGVQARTGKSRVHRAVGEARRLDRPRQRHVAPQEVDIICAGINHQTWYVKVQWRGMDMIPLMLECSKRTPNFARPRKFASTCCGASATTAPNRTVI